MAIILVFDCVILSFQAIEEEGGNPDEIVVHLEITPKKTPRRTPKGKSEMYSR